MTTLGIQHHNMAVCAVETHMRLTLPDVPKLTPEDGLGLGARDLVEHPRPVALQARVTQGNGQARIGGGRADLGTKSPSTLLL